MNYPYGQPGYPPPGYPQPGHSPQPSASGGTAITAGVFAILLSHLGVAGTVMSLAAVDRLHDRSYKNYSDFSGPLFISLAIQGIVVFLWLLGGILLLTRKNAGRVLLICLSSLGLLVCLVAVAFVVMESPLALIPGGAGVLFMVSILALTLAGSTKRWVDAGRQHY
ncbi:hypothetical protein [Nocardia thraciensis]